MVELLFVAGLGALLVGASTVAAGRWGPMIGGMLSAFPLIVGPVLFLAAERHGTAFAAQTAAATVLGLIAVSGFALAYARSALRWGWRVSLPIAWVAAAALGAVAGRVGTGLLGALGAAMGSVAIALLALPAGRGTVVASVAPRSELPLRMALTVFLIVGLSAVASRFGPVVAGVASALPTVASVLAVSTHWRQGPEASVELLRGMLGGMTAFAMFCAVVALLVEPAGVGKALVLGTVAAIFVQGAAASRLGRGGRLPTRSCVPGRGVG